MEKIKFRVWDSVTGEMIYLPNDDYYPAFQVNGEFCIRYKGKQGGKFRRVGHVMQYTGLSDDRPAEIYEGDIVKLHYFYFNGGSECKGDIVGVINMCEWGVYIKDGIGRNYINKIDTADDGIHIMGNIYKNPDLLKEISNV